MESEEFKKFCKDEFGIKVFSSSINFASMTKEFRINGRTFVDWVAKRKPRKFFGKMAELYLENKKLKVELSRFEGLGKRVEKLESK